jgi:hypothetical protein
MLSLNIETDSIYTFEQSMQRYIQNIGKYKQ